MSSDTAQDPPAVPVPGKAWQRWQEHLTLVSVPYQQMKQEQVTGWNSPVLDAFYKREGAPQQQRGTTAFRGADTDNQAERYRRHAQKIFSGDPLLATSVAVPTSRTFLDLGASPGGITRYFHDDLRWQGTAVSLAEKDGGIHMEPPRAVPPHYCFVEGSILDKSLLDVLETTHKVSRQSCDFCNAGAVQDYGQREEGGVGADDTALPWITFLSFQLKLCLQFVKPGGSIMFVFGLSDCGSLMLLLHLLRPMVRGGVRVLPTMHLAKPPVYILLSDVHYDAAAFESLSNAFDMPKEYWLLGDDADLDRAKTGFEDVRHKGLEGLWRQREELLRAKRNMIERSFNQPQRQKRPRDE